MLHLQPNEIQLLRAEKNIPKRKQTVDAPFRVEKKLPVQNNQGNREHLFSLNICKPECDCNSVA